MPALKAGSVVGDYRVQSCIRDGVYRAEQSGLGRFVALYVPDRDAERFAAAARAVAELEHPNVLPVYDVGWASGSPFAVAREAPGRRLDEMLAEGPLPEPRALRLAEQLAGALEALSRAGVRVGELSPSAVVIAEEGAGEHAYLAPLEARAEHASGGDADSAAALARLMTIMVGDEPSHRLQSALSRPHPSPSALIAATGGAVSPPRHRRRIPRIVALGALAVVIAVAVAAAVLVDGNEDSAAPERLSPAGAPSGRLVARIALGARPTSVTVADGRVWVGTTAGTVVRVDPRQEQVVGSPIRIGGPVEDSTVRAGEGAVFIATDDRLARIDASSGRITARRRLRGGVVGGMTVADGAVWITVIGRARASLLRYDSRNLRSVGRAAPTGPFPQDVDVANGVAWVTDSNGTITRIQTRTGRTLTRLVAVQPIASALQGATLWVPDRVGDVVTPVAARDLQLPDDVVRLETPIATASLGDSVWVTSTRGEDPDGPARLFRIDARSRRLAGRPVDLGPGAGWVTAGEGALWIYSRAQRALLKVVPTTPAPSPRAPERAAGELRSGPLQPGEHGTRDFVAPLRLSLATPGWVAVATHDFLGLARTDEPETTLGIFEPQVVFRPDGGVRRAGKPEQILRTLKGQPDLRISKPNETTIGGLEAIDVTLYPRRPRRIPEFCSEPCVPIVAAGPVTITADIGDRNRLVLVRRGDRSLAFSFSVQPHTRYREELEAILRTVRFLG